MIIEVDIYSQIRTLHTEGESQRSIAKRLGITRQTVKKVLQRQYTFLPKAGHGRKTVQTAAYYQTNL